MKRFGYMLAVLSVWVGSHTGNAARAADLRVTIENVQGSGGYYFTPVWLGFHDGSFDLFDMGAPASAALEAIAEDGNPAPLGMLFGSAMNGNGSARMGTVVTAPDGFAGAPVFEPGEMVSQTVSVMDPMSNRYLTFASMVIPSNDTFFGNGNPMAYPLFAADGNFQGPVVIDITASMLYDSGTEVNNGMGAAFSSLGGVASDEGGVVGLTGVNGLDNFLGTSTAAGTMISMALADTTLARIRIEAVPEPSTLSLLLLGLPWLRRRVSVQG